MTVWREDADRTRFVEAYRRWPTRADCIDRLERIRWADTPHCPYCGSQRVSQRRNAARETTAKRWGCQLCRRSFSVTVGTIFHNTHVDLQRWFVLIEIMLRTRKIGPAVQVARDLDMRRPTVWSMMRRIQHASADDRELFSRIIEQDDEARLETARTKPMRITSHRQPSPLPTTAG